MHVLLTSSHLHMLCLHTLYLLLAFLSLHCFACVTPLVLSPLYHIINIDPILSCPPNLTYTCTHPTLFPDLNLSCLYIPCLSSHMCMHPIYIHPAYIVSPCSNHLLTYALLTHALPISFHLHPAHIHLAYILPLYHLLHIILSILFQTI